ncbi:MAG TPA: hypothetical protein VGC76_06750 [Pyrinomonadaceae bacterium]|jgi:hypothetical protein
MGDKSKKPPTRNTSVKVFTRDDTSNFNSEASGASSSSGNSARNKCWTFELAELTVSPDVLQINGPVSADVTPDEITVYDNAGAKLGKAPPAAAKQISKAAESEEKFKLSGKITGKTSTAVEVKICFE